jgi:hypothetical protein
MAKATCPDDSTPEHFVLIPDDKLKVGKRGKCSRYGHRYKIVTVSPLKLKLGE